MEDPLLITIDPRGGRDGRANVNQKAFVSSLLRTLFSGRIQAISASESPLFKVERRHVDEFHMAKADSADPSKAICGQIREHVRPGPDQWVIVADPASIALRNVDHLVPPVLPGPYAPPKPDFLWAPAAGGERGGANPISPGLWAVRGEHLPTVLDAWDAALMACEHTGDHADVWTAVVRGLPLRKRRFERGEVVAPIVDSVDWRATCRAAIVTVPDWADDEQWQFLQALYLRTCLADESGMIVGLLEA